MLESQKIVEFLKQRESKAGQKYNHLKSPENFMKNPMSKIPLLYNLPSQQMTQILPQTQNKGKHPN